MRKTVIATLTVTFVIATAALTGPAVATQTSQALSICVSRGTDCTVSNKGGGHEICVNNTGGKQCVNCPALTAKDQTCTVAKTRNVSGVAGILRGGNRMPLKADSDGHDAGIAWCSTRMRIGPGPFHLRERRGGEEGQPDHLHERELR